MNKMIMLLVLILTNQVIYGQKHNDSEINLQRIAQKISAKKVIGIGEGTHGTKEITQFRIDLIKELVVHHDYRFIIIEQSFGDTYFLNKIVNSNLNIKESLPDYLLSMWQSEEMLSFLMWVRHFNQNNSDNMIVLQGMDVNFNANTVNVLKENISNKGIKELIDELYKIALFQDRYWESYNTDDDLYEYEDLVKNGLKGYEIITELKKKETLQTNRELKLAILNLELNFRTWLEMSNNNENYTRDFIMYNMIKEFYVLYNKKIIVLAHNAHVSAHETLIDGFGGYLREYLSKDYYAIGTFVAYGSYNVTNDQIDSKKSNYFHQQLPEILENSWEEYFSTNFSDEFFLELNKNKSEFNEYRSFLLLGYSPITAQNYKYIKVMPLKLTDCFDAVCFIKNSTPTQLINKN